MTSYDEMQCFSKITAQTQRLSVRETHDRCLEVKIEYGYDLAFKMQQWHAHNQTNQTCYVVAGRRNWTTKNS